MDKEKLANGVMWISVAMLFIFTAALSLTKGFQQDNNLYLIGGGISILGVFFYGFKGINTILDAFFNKK